MEQFDLFTHGLDTFRNASYRENFEDSLRHYAEECNLVQVTTNLSIFKNRITEFAI